MQQEIINALTTRHCGVAYKNKPNNTYVQHHIHEPANCAAPRTDNKPFTGNLSTQDNVHAGTAGRKEQNMRCMKSSSTMFR